MKPLRSPFAPLKNVDWWVYLVAASLCLVSLVFLKSSTQDDPRFQAQFGKQALFAVIGLGVGVFCMLPHYVHALRLWWIAYGGTTLALLLLPVFGSIKNGARRWYDLPGVSVQPSEFAKLGVVIGLAALLRFPRRPTFGNSLVAPGILAAIPAALVVLQPDLGSTLVFVPIVLAMSYAAGAKGRHVALLCVVGFVAFVAAYFSVMHGYQKDRIDVWAQHWAWDPETPQVKTMLRGQAYQPWQALIAMGSGGLFGFGVGQGPQNRYDFLPYRSEDYIFAVVAEEIGFVGSMGVMVLYATLVLGLLRIAGRTRERFGRLLCVGVAAWIGSQSLMHAAVCAWLVPSTGVPMPLLSYGGSSVLATLLGVALCCNVSARREPVLAGDGYR